MERLLLERSRLEQQLAATRQHNEMCSATSLASMSATQSLSSSAIPHFHSPASRPLTPTISSWETASVGSDSSWQADLRERREACRTPVPTIPVADWDPTHVAQFLSS